METFCIYLKEQKIISQSSLNFENFKSYSMLSKVQNHTEDGNSTCENKLR